MTGAVAPWWRSSVLSIVNLVERMLEPFSLMSTVKMEPEACAVVRGML